MKHECDDACGIYPEPGCPSWGLQGPGWGDPIAPWGEREEMVALVREVLAAELPAALDEIDRQRRQALWASNGTGS